MMRRPHYICLLVFVTLTVSAAVVINQHEDGAKTGLASRPGQHETENTRILGIAAGFVLEKIAGELIGAAVPKLVDYILGNGGSSLIELESTLKGVEKKVNDIGRKLDDLAEELERARVDDQLGPVIINIEIHFHKLAENIELLTKEQISGSELERRNQIVASFLDVSTGVETGLDLLRLIILGKHKFNGVSILEDYWNSMIRNQDMLNFIPDEKLRLKMAPFLSYLLKLQDMGFGVWYTAVTAKYANSSKSQEYHQKIVNDTHHLHAVEMMTGLSHLLGPCDERTLIGTPGYPIYIQCTNGTDRSYGAICHQRYGREGSERDYPRQCLITGQWSVSKGIISSQGAKLNTSILATLFSVLVSLIIWANNDI